jgi:uncharacterized membrane protein
MDGGRGVRPVLPAAAALATFAVVVYLLAPAAATPVDAAAALPAASSRVRAIVEQRCVPCHAVNPTEPGFSAPPNGLVFQTLDQLAAHAPEVQQQLQLRTMPLGNLTQMSEDERDVLLQWIGHRPH